MKRFLALAIALAALGPLHGPPPAHAKDPGHLLGVPDSQPVPADPFSGGARIWKGWDGFLDGWEMLDLLLVFALAAALGAIIAFHPRTRRKAATIEELEQPKTFILYALVGSIIAIIVQVVPAMSLVIFAIGGLMRFRTDVGPAKDTGRVILTAVVGVCCGLKLIVLAVMATAFGWLLLFYLERETYGRLLVKGLLREAVPRAAEAYRRVLLDAGCRVLAERKKFIKGQVTFVFTAPYTLDKEQFEQTRLSNVPEEIRGTVDWDVS